MWQPRATSRGNQAFLSHKPVHGNTFSCGRCMSTTGKAIEWFMETQFINQIADVTPRGASYHGITPSAKRIATRKRESINVCY